MLKLTSYILFTLLMGLSVAYGSSEITDKDLRLEKRLERSQAQMLYKFMNKKGRVSEMDQERARDYLTQSKSEALENLRSHEFKSINTLVSN